MQVTVAALQQVMTFDTDDTGLLRCWKPAGHDHSHEFHVHSHGVLSMLYPALVLNPTLETSGA